MIISLKITHIEVYTCLTYVLLYTGMYNGFENNIFLGSKIFITALFYFEKLCSIFGNLINKNKYLKYQR